MNLSAFFRLFTQTRSFSYIVFICLSFWGATSCYEENLSSTSSLNTLNLCEGQASNTFHCLDDTRFQLCTGNDEFVVRSCPVGLCATRSPANKNPCIGRERAAKIDGVEPPFPGVTNPPEVDTEEVDVEEEVAAENDSNRDDFDDFDGDGDNGVQCTGGPAFDPAGAPNVGNARGIQFIGGQCLSNADCASGCCAGPCGICSAEAVQFAQGKTGCGFIY